MRGIRLDSGESEGANQRLCPRIVPILARCQERVFGTPLNEFLLRVEAALDETARRKRIQHEQRRQVGFTRRQQVYESLGPRIAGSESGLGVPASEERADGAVVRFETVLNMKRFPWAALFVFRKCRAVRVPIPEGAHVGVARHGAAL